ncbi:MAG: hypothetical protein E5W81_00535 [Mesorhizobium sp.]|nr:MAG: hypothetical protein E5W81_00535 [Mesorhizobium sp.]
MVEEERQEEERKANRRAQYMSGIVKAKEKKRKGDRERQARRRDKLAEAQGRTINRRRNLKNMTPEQLVAYKRNQWKEKKRRQCGTSRPASHPLFGKF